MKLNMSNRDLDKHFDDKKCCKVCSSRKVQEAMTATWDQLVLLEIDEEKMDEHRQRTLVCQGALMQ